MGMLQYPFYNDLSSFIENNPSVNLPDNTSDLMLKVIITINSYKFDQAFFNSLFSSLYGFSTMVEK